MESKIEKTRMIELTVKEQIEIDGGSERTDEKRSGFWEKLTQLLKL